MLINYLVYCLLLSKFKLKSSPSPIAFSYQSFLIDSFETMASKPPGKCCLEGHFKTGNPIGSDVKLYGIPSYTVGDESLKSEKIVIIFPDIYGYDFINVRLIADQFAKAGYYTIIPDILEGDSAVFGKTNLQEWLAKHSPEKVRKISDVVIDGIIGEHQPKFIGTVGYCFGAKFVIQYLGTDKIQAGAVAHPSFVTIDEVAAVKNPLLINAAETDHIFTPELRVQTEAKLKEIGARYFLTLGSGISHGFAVRGDDNDPVVKFAKDKALADQITWFNVFSGSD